MRLSRRVGTLEWLDATGGVLRPRDRVRLIAQGLLTQMSDSRGQLVTRVGVRRQGRIQYSLDRLEIPDSPAAKEAEELCRDLGSPALLNHSYRTYVWASVVAAHEELTYDEEVVYVASLLHDLGLLRPVSEDGRPRCFTAVGAKAALELGDRFSWPAGRSQCAAEAIGLHMNARVAGSDPVEARLVTAGTALDAVGAGHWRMHPDTVAAVCARYPREGFKDLLGSAFGEQAAINHGTRSHFYVRYLGLRRRFQRAPFST